MTTTTTPAAIEVQRGLDPAEAVRRAGVALREGQVRHLEAALYLGDLSSRRGYKALGKRSMRQLAIEELRQPPSTVCELAAIGRGLLDLPVISAFVAAGRVSITHAKYLVKVATPQTERAWAEFAEPRTVDDVKVAVAVRDKGDLPAAKPRRIHTPKLRAGGDLTPTQYAAWSRYREKVEAMLGRSVTDGELMDMSAKHMLCMRPDGTIPGWTPVNDVHYQLHVYPRSDGQPGLVTSLANGNELAIEPVELQNRPLIIGAGAEPDTVELATLDPANAGPMVAEHLRDEPTSDGLRVKVLERDGYRCRRCGASKNLTVHHRHWRSRGGKTVLSNLLTLCEDCHSLVHARYLIVVGEPEGELEFLDRRGRHANDPPPPAQLTTVTVLGPPPDAPRVDLDTLPSEVDPDWWARHQHLLSWSERHGELELTPGHSRDAASAPTPTPTEPPVSTTLSELVGQEAVRAQLAVAIAAAKQRGEPLGHVLLAGGPGLGKTTLARALAAELGQTLTLLPAPHVKTTDVLVRALASLRGGVLFLDELHALPHRAAEVLYEALDSGTLTLAVRQGLTVRTLRLRLAPFTLVGATTELDQLAAPLLSRLSVRRLERYKPEELAALLVRAAREYELELTPDAARALADASRETPRRALALLRVTRDEATTAGVSTVDLALVERALALEGVDQDGLDATDRRYLAALDHADGPIGLSALAAQVDVSEAVLRNVHEPHLLRRGLVQITSQGRVRVA